MILNRDKKDLIIVDNAAYSFLLDLENGIPILPFYHHKGDVELNKLARFLISIKDVNDVRDVIKKHFRWSLF